MNASTSPTALVLAGGAARGAYEVGVVQHVFENVSRDLGHPVPIDILCGTSVGAINTCMLAAFADEPAIRASRLARHWTDLRIDAVLQPDLSEALALARGFLFGRTPSDTAPIRRGGLFDPRGLEQILGAAVPFERIADHVRAGLLDAVSISTTHVATGRTVLFIDRAGRPLPAWRSDPKVAAVQTQLTARHAIASAAIPFLFPAVRIDGEVYCDGGLRQYAPLSPAHRLGADRLLVVNPHHPPAGPASSAVAASRVEAFPSPLFLLGKTLNALLLDRIDNDIDHLRMINRILGAGTARYGANFVDEINRTLGSPAGKHDLRPLRIVVVRASQDLGRMSAEFARSQTFGSRVRGPLGYAMRRLAEGESETEADLLSYLLFDGEFAGQLIELGRADARAHHEQLCAFFAEATLRATTSRAHARP